MAPLVFVLTGFDCAEDHFQLYILKAKGQL